MELKGKNIAFLGDSITEGTGVSNRKANRYDNRIKKICELGNTYNYGIGGTRFAYQTRPSEKPRYDLYFCGRVYNIDRNAHIIIVFGGTNDYGHGDAPLGGQRDKTPDTFYGATDFLMTFIKTNYPKAQAVFMTPARREGDLFPSNHASKGEDKRPLLDYVRAIKEKGTEHGIPVLDLYHEMNIDPNILEDKKKYTVDGLHLNDEGHEILADCLIKFLKSL